MSGYAYNCETASMRGTGKMVRTNTGRDLVPSKVRPSRPGGAFLNSTIKGRKLA